MVYKTTTYLLRAISFVSSAILAIATLTFPRSGQTSRKLLVEKERKYGWQQPGFERSISCNFICSEQNTLSVIFRESGLVEEENAMYQGPCNLIRLKFIL